MTSCMNWLAIETSTEHLSVAACRVREDAVWSSGLNAGLNSEPMTSPEAVEIAVREGPGGAQTSLALLPAIEAVLAQLQLDVGQLQAIAFGQGPGAFTGLRAACAVAQGLALGADLPVLPIDGLSQIAQTVREQQPQLTRVLVTMDARMGQVYWGALQWRNDHWHPVQDIAVSDPHEVHWPAGWQGDDTTAVAGSWVSTGPDAQAEQVFRERNLGPHTWLAARPNARAMLRLAPSAWQRGLAVLPDFAAPLYVRNKVAQTTAEREAHRLQASAEGPA